MAWRVLAAKGLVSPGESMVGASVRAVHPLVAFVLIGGGAALALVSRRLLAGRRKVDAFAAGISGAGAGAALVFFRTHGLGGLPTLALAAAAALFMARRDGGTGPGGRREIAPKRRRKPYAAAVPPVAARPAIGADLAYVASSKFVSPPRLEHGSVSHYAPPKTPVSRYRAPGTGAMAPAAGREAAAESISAQEADVKLTIEEQTAEFEKKKARWDALQEIPPQAPPRLSLEMSISDWLVLQQCPRLLPLFQDHGVETLEDLCDLAHAAEDLQELGATAEQGALLWSVVEEARAMMTPRAAPAPSPLINTPLRGSATATEVSVAVDASTTLSHQFIVGWSQLPGQKNEDTISVARSSAMQYAGVFDGHRGKAVAAFLAKELHGAIEKTLADSSGMEMPGSLNEAFRSVNERVRALQLKGGSTGVVLCAMEADHPRAGGLWCANCGDSRAVAFALSGGDATPTQPAVRVSVDHTPNAAGETERILAVGGIVEFNCLDGVLEVCRGFGDFDIIGMTSHPHVMRVDASKCGGANTAEAVVLIASDGLWDVCTDDEAADFTREWLSDLETVDGEEMASHGALLAHVFPAVRGGAGGDTRLSVMCTTMASWAAERGARDDISIACVRLRPADWPQRVTRGSVERGSAVTAAPPSAARPPRGLLGSGGTLAPATTAAATPAAGTPASAAVAATPAPAELCLRVVSAQRGGEPSEEWAGDVVTVTGATDLQALTANAGGGGWGQPGQQWDWGSRFKYEVTMQPVHDSGGGIGAGEWLVEMYVKGEGYVLRGRLTVNDRQRRVILLRNEQPNGPYPPPAGAPRLAFPDDEDEGPDPNLVRMTLTVGGGQPTDSGAGGGGGEAGGGAAAKVATPSRKILFE